MRKIGRSPKCDHRETCGSHEAEGINEVNELNIQEDGLTVILFVGVNGVGKTTSIGKLAHQFKTKVKSIDGSRVPSALEQSTS